MIDNKLISTSIFSGVCVIFLAGNAQAINTNFSKNIEDRKANVEEKKTEILCGRIDNIIDRLEKNIENDGVKLRERNEEKIREMKETGKSRDAESEERRIMRDEARERFYEELEEKYEGDAAKKEAVETFRNRVEEAIRIRRESIDGAKDAMNAGIEIEVRNRETKMETLRKEFEGKIQTAINIANNSCGTDTTNDELKNVLSQLKEDVKNARDDYKSKVKEAKKVQTSIQNLREVRKASVKSAIEIFKAAMKSAQEELRTAMGAQK